MTGQPLVSVMIGVYNAERYLGEAIQSVLDQTYEPTELIVVDDGSTDASAEVARSFGHAVRYTRQERGGNGAARNHAVELARGEHFAFLDADDRFLPLKLEQQMEVLSATRWSTSCSGMSASCISPDLDESPAPACDGPPRTRRGWRRISC